MHEAFWNGLFDVRWEDSPLGAEALRLVVFLRKRGYTERTRRDYAHAVVHLGRVLREKLADTLPQSLDEATVEDFIKCHMPACCCYRRRAGRGVVSAKRGLMQLLSMLREEGVIPPPVSNPPQYHEILDGYCRFLRDDRGLADTTVINYRCYLRDFLISRGDAIEPRQLAQLTATDLLAFGCQRGKSLGVTAWNHLSLALSNFYRWLDLCGYGGTRLVNAIPMRRKFRLADVPCALSSDQIRRLLAVVDRHAPTGLRNYAMLLLMATYGLRGCEVRALRIDDIDWSKDEITIFASKTGRRRKLPLTRPVGEAILEYLREKRPASQRREIFLSSNPPHERVRNKLNNWLSKCFDRAGIKTSRRGGHTLRHSLAVNLLRGGETLKSIGDVLGHRSPDTTYIYTKLHFEELRTVALEPEVVS